MHSCLCVATTTLAYCLLNHGCILPWHREDPNYLMPFKEFMLKRVPDDCAPEDAQRMYQVSRQARERVCEGGGGGRGSQGQTIT